MRQMTPRPNARLISVQAASEEIGIPIDTLDKLIAREENDAFGVRIANRLEQTLLSLGKLRPGFKTRLAIQEHLITGRDQPKPRRFPQLARRRTPGPVLCDSAAGPAWRARRSGHG